MDSDTKSLEDQAVNYFHNSDFGIPNSDFSEYKYNRENPMMAGGGGGITGIGATDWFAPQSTVFDSPEKSSTDDLQAPFRYPNENSDPIEEMQAQFRVLNMINPNLSIAQLDLLTPNYEEPALNPWDNYNAKPLPVPRFRNNYAYSQHQTNNMHSAAPPAYYPEPFAETQYNHGGAIPKRPLAPIAIPQPALQQSLNMPYMQQQETGPDFLVADNLQHHQWFDRPQMSPNAFHTDPSKVADYAGPSTTTKTAAATPSTFSLKFVELLLEIKRMTEIGLLDRDLLDQPISPVTLTLIYHIVVIEKDLDELRREGALNYCEQEANMKLKEDVLRKEIRAEQTSYLASMKTRMMRKQQHPHQPQVNEHNIPRKW